MQEKCVQGLWKNKICNILNVSFAQTWQESIPFKRELNIEEKKHEPSKKTLLEA